MGDWREEKKEKKQPWPDLPLPRVQEFCEKFGITGDLATRLEDQLRKRPLVYMSDLEAIAESLCATASIAGCISMKIKEMQEGTFHCDFPIPALDDFRSRFKLIPDEVFEALRVLLRNRPISFEGDLETIEEAVYEDSRPPTVVLLEHIKTLLRGDFRGKPANFKMLQEITTTFDIDAKAMNSLTETLHKVGKDKAKVALSDMRTHLERSNKTSAMVIHHLKKIRDGKVIGESTHLPSKNSLMWYQQQADAEQEGIRKEQDAERRERSRSRKRAEKRYSSRDRGHDRRDRDYDRGRDREHDRDRTWENRGDREYDRDRNGENRDYERDRAGDDRRYGGNRDDRDRGRDQDYDRGRGRGDNGRGDHEAARGNAKWAGDSDWNRGYEKQDRDDNNRDNRDRGRASDRDRGDRGRDRSDRDRW